MRDHPLLLPYSLRFPSLDPTKRLMQRFTNLKFLEAGPTNYKATSGLDPLLTNNSLRKESFLATTTRASIN